MVRPFAGGIDLDHCKIGELPRMNTSEGQRHWQAARSEEASVPTTLVLRDPSLLRNHRNGAGVAVWYYQAS
jgi:hypothetical protein